MQILPTKALSFLWIIWVISWWAAALWSDRDAKRASSISQAPNQIMVISGALLLFGFARLRYHDVLLTPIGEGAAWCMVALAAAGLSFAWWARIHLGRLWSRWVVSKADHRIIQSGPYSVVRHPIYTGIGLASLATAVIYGTGFAYLGAALIILSFYIKARLEEQFLRQELGAAAYEDYSRRVPMLVPLLRI
jgi:protein-S-isoprenylcysteine O-methyltransferase Ste14